MPAHPGPAFGRPECKLVAGIHVFKTDQDQKRGWHRNSGLPEFRTIKRHKSGKPDLW